MHYISTYASPLGELILASDNIGLIGLWFKRQKYEFAGLADNPQNEENLHIALAKEWLDMYFSGKEPNFLPSLHPQGSSFRQSVWKILLSIPYGKTLTYGEIAQKLAKEKGIQKMSAQAVGGAVGHNPIGIIIPCHRVVGTNGNLTGYAGGIQRKLFLLQLEGMAKEAFSIPTKGTAL